MVNQFKRKTRYLWCLFLLFPSAKASSHPEPTQRDLQLTRSLEVAHFPKDVIGVVVIYAGFGLEEQILKANTMLKEGKEFIPKGMDWNRHAFILDNRTKYESNYLKGSNLIKDAVYLRFNALRIIDSLNRDPSQQEAFVMVFETHKQPLRGNVRIALQKIAKNYHLGQRLIAQRYNQLMIGHRKGDSCHWECLESLVDFLLDPLPINRYLQSTEKTTTTPQAIFNWVAQQGSSLWDSVKSFWG